MPNSLLRWKRKTPSWGDLKPVTIPSLEAAIEFLDGVEHFISEARKATALGEKHDEGQAIELRIQIRAGMSRALLSLDRQQRKVMR